MFDIVNCVFPCKERGRILKVSLFDDNSRHSEHNETKIFMIIFVMKHCVDLWHFCVRFSFKDKEPRSILFLWKRGGIAGAPTILPKTSELLWRCNIFCQLWRYFSERSTPKCTCRLSVQSTVTRLCYEDFCAGRTLNSQCSAHQCIKFAYGQSHTYLTVWGSKY